MPPSEPDSHQGRPNNLTTVTSCDHSGDGASPVKRKVQEKDINIAAKNGDPMWPNMQKSLKKPGNQHNIDLATKTPKSSNLTTSGELAAQMSENGVIPDLLPDDNVDLKAVERLDAIISNVMAKELINTTSSREEQILRKQQILEELQKVEKELQEKAKQQWLITVEQQHQQQQQLQQVLQRYRPPLQQVHTTLSSSCLASFRSIICFYAVIGMAYNLHKILNVHAHVHRMSENILTLLVAMINLQCKLSIQWLK